MRRLVENLKKRDWTAVLLELVIVVVGILVALQITEWNDARHDRMRERDYLVRIAADLDQSTRDMERSIMLSNKREQFGVLLMQSVGDPELVRANPGRFMLALQEGGYTFSPAVRSHTFDEIKSVGDLDLFQDKSLLAGITEFYTNVDNSGQWNYIRELTQTEYMKRGAGILSYDEQSRIMAADGVPEFSADVALAARARMLEHPTFIAWLPTVANRADDVDSYRKWLAQAKQVRARIGEWLARGAD